MHLDMKKIMTPSTSLDVKTNFGYLSFTRLSHVEDNRVTFALNSIMYKKRLIKDNVNCPYVDFNKTYIKLDLELEVGIQSGLVYFATPFRIWGKNDEDTSLCSSFFDACGQVGMNEPLFLKEQMDSKFETFINECVNGNYYTTTYYDGITFLRELETLPSAFSNHTLPDGRNIRSLFKMVVSGEIYNRFGCAGRIVQRTDSYENGDVIISYFIIDAFGLMTTIEKPEEDKHEDVVIIKPKKVVPA